MEGVMKRIPAWIFMVLFAFAMAAPSFAQTQEVKVMGETIAVQAEGTYQADPDLATLTFVVTSQDKELKRAYDTAAQSLKRIGDLAGKYGLQKEDVTTGILTVVPSYDNSERKRKARFYSVDGRVVLRLRDFVKIGPIIDEAMQDGVTDFRSLTYSLSDEEAAKQKAVAEAMRRAAGRANTALEQRGQKLGALRYANLDVKGIQQIQEIVPYGSRSTMVGSLAMTTSVTVGGDSTSGRNAPTPLPMPHPDKIGVTATVQCVFQIQ
jgi:uncharacterized protein YggE